MNNIFFLLITLLSAALIAVGGAGVIYWAAVHDAARLERAMVTWFRERRA
jgi:hypothetical protein